jgi:hypothetical protein
MTNTTKAPIKAAASNATATGMWPLAPKNWTFTDRVFWTTKTTNATPRTTAKVTAAQAALNRVTT